MDLEEEELEDEEEMEVEEEMKVVQNSEWEEERVEPQFYGPLPALLRSQRDMHPLKKEVWIPINSGYGPDLGGPQKRNFSSGSPHT